MSESGKNNSHPGKGLNRRSFLKGMGTGIVGSATLSQGLLSAAPQGPTPSSKSQDITSATVTMTINGKRQSLEVEPRESLAHVLRERLQLTGTKIVCDRGECGACTVILNGRTVYSCMMLALEAEGARITTIEGLAVGEKLHPIQEAFVKHDALMCGYCTPGFELALKGLLDQNPNPNLQEIKRGLSGNICRCGTYPHIFNAALELAGGKGGK
ncbi:MAG: hypothetical protein A3F83_03885 [Candidatus Glassbacteria bacterium RIFCSPLOWO2_12_FULL_58_11]|uniref:2Fe-2S ferredoxin-type domain-containing protein n=1 Tax=Candidatus Glassbacteria bacterium RIFCSPLOWO2_12_FULL_58_11 TaxID=1817867 RepID=A0A1F5YN09_9BACT|nr:MAG: hypothetical protein A3F83_03885 [Candidatus Glassbacteria bacterium RIFCSPLOWO2_12_FULL_58_11]